MVHEEGMKLAVVATAVPRVAIYIQHILKTLEGLQQTLLRCFHFRFIIVFIKIAGRFIFVFIKIAGSDLFRCESLRCAVFPFTRLFKIPTKFSCIDLLLHVKLPEE